jgi:hypothetical protein
MVSNAQVRVPIRCTRKLCSFLRAVVTLGLGFTLSAISLGPPSMLALADPTPSPIPTLTPTSSPSTPNRNPTLGVSVPQTQNIGPPVELDVCQPYYVGGLILGHIGGFAAKFTNDTNLTADVVEIQVLDANGTAMGTIRDVGSFAPGIEVSHKYKEGSGTMTFSPLFSRTRVTCSIWAVHFTDGTVWRAQAQPVGSYSHDATPVPTVSPQTANVPSPSPTATAQLETARLEPAIDNSKQSLPVRIRSVRHLRLPYFIAARPPATWNRSDGH